MHCRSSLALLGFALLLWLAACSGAPDANQTADTPEALLEKFVRAVETLDAVAVAACLDTETEHGQRVADLLIAGFRSVRRQREFEAAVTAKHGEEFARDRLGLGPAGPAALIDRVRTLRKSARIDTEGDTATVKILDPAGNDRSDPPAKMARRKQGWIFGVAPYLPDDTNLCTNLIYILDTFRTRYEHGLQALKDSDTREAFLEAMKAIDQQANTAAREAMVVVEPFMARYR